MPIPSWPAVPYRPLRNGYSKSPLLAPIRTEMDGGNVRMRRRPGDNVSIVSQTIWMTNSEFATLESWVSSTLGGGVARFTMSVWLGSAYSSKTCQFEAKGQDFPYSVASVGPDTVAVSMVLRVFSV